MTATTTATTDEETGAPTTVTIGPATVYIPDGPLTLATEYTVTQPGQDDVVMRVGALEVLSGGLFLDGLRKLGRSLAPLDAAVDPAPLSLNVPPPSGLTAASWREYLHPRDWRGRFIQKGDIVDLPGGIVAKVVDLEGGDQNHVGGVATVELADGRRGKIDADKLTLDPIVEQSTRRAARAARIADAASAAAAAGTGLSHAGKSVDHRAAGFLVGKTANAVAIHERQSAANAYRDAASSVAPFDRERAAQYEDRGEQQRRLAGYQQAAGYVQNALDRL